MFDDFNILDSMDDDYDLSQDSNDSVNLNNEIGYTTEETIISAPYNLPELVDSPVSDLNDELISDKSKISFGNMWDDRTESFLKDCKTNGIDLPSSVTHCGNGIDRAFEGGLTSIDKSIIEGKLKSLHDAGNLSDSTYNNLKSRLWSC